MTEAAKEETPKEEPKIYNLKGAVNYELELHENQFAYRSQVSTENNLANLLAIRELYGSMIKHQESPAVQKPDKISKEEMFLIKSAYRVTALHAERLAAVLYKQALEKNLEPDKPKIEIVQPTAGLRKV